MKRLTLSFDNGPFPDVTPGVLDVLAERGLPATFFVCGREASQASRRRILERARADGHRIGNHTLSHNIELGATDDRDAPRREIEESQQILGELAGSERLFRPYGAGGVLSPRLLSQQAANLLCDGGYSCVLWNSVPRDWEDPADWPTTALAHLHEQDWTLIVLHDVPTGAMAALPGFLDRVAEQEIEVVAEFPPECVPILEGRVVGPIDHLIAAD
ncbi:MAG: polysaccharide deacetylase family protein [Deltaproteobacteria bacterium]|nr:polysaccharide deacetylase family protein [Deltaproteobacteria bacterium]MBW2396652.1 polysaccharide deacetylase family protein [Deltaproteobacteria bacterium]